MPKIIWRGAVKPDACFLEADIPANARVLREPDTISGVLVRALPFMAPLVILTSLCLIIKSFHFGGPVFNPVGFPIGFAVGFVLLLVHELLHAAAYPKDATVEIGIIPRAFAAFAVSSAPLSRRRFIVSALLPFVLGIVPLVVFCVLPPGYKMLNAIFWGCAMMGMVSPYPDLYNVWNILRQTPQGATIQCSRGKTYWFVEA